MIQGKKENKKNLLQTRTKQQRRPDVRRKSSDENHQEQETKHSKKPPLTPLLFVSQTVSRFCFFVCFVCVLPSLALPFFLCIFSSQDSTTSPVHHAERSNHAKCRFTPLKYLRHLLCHAQRTFPFSHLPSSSHQQSQFFTHCVFVFFFWCTTSQDTIRKKNKK